MKYIFLFLLLGFFEIQTEGLDVREPKFKKALEGIANNGFEGKGML